MAQLQRDILVLVGEHNGRVVNPDFGMANFPAGDLHAEQLLRAERLLVEFKRASGALHDRIRSRRVAAIGDRIDGNGDASGGD